MSQSGDQTRDPSEGTDANYRSDDYATATAATALTISLSKGEKKSKS